MLHPQPLLYDTLSIKHETLGGTKSAPSCPLNIKTTRTPSIEKKMKQNTTIFIAAKLQSSAATCHPVALFDQNKYENNTVICIYSTINSFSFLLHPRIENTSQAYLFLARPIPPILCMTPVTQNYPYGRRKGGPPGSSSKHNLYNKEKKSISSSILS